jgi:aspartyl-tRNA(Asn)/glutamyl-tRNA(Gln) amidotransferase subunit A
VTAAWRRGFRFGAPTPVDRAEAAIEAAAGDPHRAYLARHPGALDDARAAALRWRQGRPRSRLDGVPFAAKDNLLVRGLPCTAGSRILDGWHPGLDATVVRRLRRAGAVLVGKTNLDEFGMGATGEHSAYGPTSNPRHTGWVPGGSSSGSAAALAAGGLSFALGSDTGGSIRIPAAFCRLVGLKPSWGRLSRHGLIAFASSLDCVGLLAHRIDDLQLVLSIAEGPDPRDATCVASPPEPPVDVRSVGLLQTDAGWFWDRAEPVLRALTAAGIRTTPVRGPDPSTTLAAYHVLSTAEASSNLARYDGLRFGQRVPAPSYSASMVASRRAGFGAEVQRRIAVGAWLLSADDPAGTLGRAQTARDDIRRTYRTLFAEHDLLLGPTTDAPLGFDRPAAEHYWLDRFATGPSLAELCALSLPLPPEQPPLSMQIVGPRFAERRLFGMGRRLERWLELPSLTEPERSGD